MHDSRLAHEPSRAAAPRADSARFSSEPANDAVVAGLTVAQRIWGWGNLSPLDDVFGSTAIIRLALSRASKFGLVACRFGSRLQRYSKEAGLWIDAFESERRHALLQREKDIKCTFKAWTNDEKLLGMAKFTDLALLESGKVSDSLPLICRQCAVGLKKDGKLFLADVMLPNAGPLTVIRSVGQGWTRSDHERALAAAGLLVREEMDLTRDVVAKIRHGLVGIADMLIEARKLDEPQKKLTRTALGTEIETWARMAMLLESGKMAATGILAIKP